MSYKQTRSRTYGELGIGTIVQAKKALGGVLKDVPKGAKGEVVDYFGGPDRPVVHFEGTPEDRRIVIDYPERELKVVKHVGPEKPKIAFKSGEYYDDGYGHYFYYDIEIPGFETSRFKMKIDGMTKEEYEKEIDKVWEKIPEEARESVRNYLNNEATDVEETVAQEYTDEMGEIRDLEARRDLFDYWENQPFEDLKDMGFEIE